MHSAMWVASVFGPLMIILGIWMLFYHDNMMKVINSVKSTPSAFFIGAILNVFLGLVVINHFNVWTMSLSVFVTLLGWVLLIRGVLAMFLPQFFIKAAMGNPNWLKVKGIVPLVWGLLLCWLGYWS